MKGYYIKRYIEDLVKEDYDVYILLKEVEDQLDSTSLNLTKAGTVNLR
jgi:hypothetical protein